MEHGWNTTWASFNDSGVRFGGGLCFPSLRCGESSAPHWELFPEELVHAASASLVHTSTVGQAGQDHQKSCSPPEAVAGGRPWWKGRESLQSLPGHPALEDLLPASFAL